MLRKGTSESRLAESYACQAHRRPRAARAMEWAVERGPEEATLGLRERELKVSSDLLLGARLFFLL